MMRYAFAYAVILVRRGSRHACVQTLSMFLNFRFPWVRCPCLCVCVCVCVCVCLRWGAAMLYEVPCASDAVFNYVRTKVGARGGEGVPLDHARALGGQGLARLLHQWSGSMQPLSAGAHGQ